MRHILVVRFSSIGDIILTEPIIRGLKTAFPEASISFLTKQTHVRLLEMFDNIETIHAWVDDKQGSRLINQLKRSEIDLVVDLHNNLRSARVRLAIRVRSVKTKKEWFKRIAAVRWNSLGGKPLHALDRYANVLQELGQSKETGFPSLHVPDTASQWWKDHSSEGYVKSDYYVIAAGATHETKRAPDNLWCALADAATREFAFLPIMVGAPSERFYLTELAKKIAHPTPMVVTEENITNAAAVIKTARFVVSNDSGLAHLASALSTPVVALFGPTHPVLGFAPLGAKAGHYTVNEFCSPCSLHGDKKCIRDQRYCFTKMNAEEILKSIRLLLR